MHRATRRTCRWQRRRCIRREPSWRLGVVFSSVDGLRCSQVVALLDGRMMSDLKNRGGESAFYKTMLQLANTHAHNQARDQTRAGVKADSLRWWLSIGQPVQGGEMEVLFPSLSIATGMLYGASLGQLSCYCPSQSDSVANRRLRKAIMLSSVKTQPRLLEGFEKDSVFGNVTQVSAGTDYEPWQKEARSSFQPSHWEIRLCPNPPWHGHRSQTGLPGQVRGAAHFGKHRRLEQAVLVEPLICKSNQSAPPPQVLIPPKICTCRVISYPLHDMNSVTDSATCSYVPTAFKPQQRACCPRKETWEGGNEAQSRRIEITTGGVGSSGRHCMERVGQIWIGC